MANICEITGKKQLRGNRVSHANNKTIHFQQPSVLDRALFVPELKSRFKVRISNAGLRTIDKVGGLSRYVVQSSPETLSPRLRQLRKVLLKRGVN